MLHVTKRVPLGSATIGVPTRSVICGRQRIERRSEVPEHIESDQRGARTIDARDRDRHVRDGHAAETDRVGRGENRVRRSRRSGEAMQLTRDRRRVGDDDTGHASGDRRVDGLAVQCEARSRPTVALSTGGRERDRKGSNPIATRSTLVQRRAIALAHARGAAADFNPASERYSPASRYARARSRFDRRRVAAELDRLLEQRHANARGAAGNEIAAERDARSRIVRRESRTAS